MKNKLPSNWSENALKIFREKYMRGSEQTVEDTVLRVVTALASAAVKQKHFDENSVKNFRDQLTKILISQKAAFNSPVWFNCGLYEAYGKMGDSENWAYDFATKKSLPVKSAFERPQVSACFIQSIDDRLLSIFELVKTEARLFKFGSGTGTNFSVLRARGEALSQGGVSSGLMAFLEVFDKAAQATKSGGITRRAAKMVVLNHDHAEIREFIQWKVKEERKALALIKAGYSVEEAYATVSGQNSNNSVRVTDDFLQAVEAKDSAASDLFQQMAVAAWECADPGVQFHDEIQRWHTCPRSGVIEASNPCSEYFFLNDSACNLSSVNLVKFLTESGDFLFDEYMATISLLIRAQEILVDYGSYPTEKIADNSHRFRPLGLGYSHLGGFLLRQGVAYGSLESQEWTAFLTAALYAGALKTSAEMAKSHGTFEGFDENQDDCLRVVGQHHQAWKEAKLVGSKNPAIADLAKRLDKIFIEAVLLSEKHGLRNAQLTAIAPTGTISLIMDCDTTGIEPEFSWLKQKKLVGGGVLDLRNNNLTAAWTRLGYTSADQQEFLKELNEKGSFLGAKSFKKQHQDIFLTAMRDLVVGRELSAIDHLNVAAAAQPFVSGGISKTVNMPKEASASDVATVFLEAWHKKLKSVSIYRDGSKGMQPLQSRDPSCEVCS